jgi:signal transduction histidine kinase
MAVSDDGVGFDTSGLVSMSQRQGGLGTLSMHERANYVGGELTITSTQRKGTRVRLQIPMAP